MRVLHNSRDSRYRTPYGAAQLGGVVTLSVEVWDDPGATATIRTWIDGVGEQFWPMEGTSHDGMLTFMGQLPLEHLDVTWYCFWIQGSDGRIHYYGAKEGRTGGVGQMYEYMPPSFQITVYHDRPVRPDWYAKGMVYQIFPDRYKRDDAWRERAEAALAAPRAGVPRRLVEDWDTPPTYDRDENGRIKVWDFYGGTLEGIRQDLDRIAGMGFTAIYLNPIFEAQSNHRYDTGDYLAIDPLLGTEDDFKHLCADAAEKGISIILDGVFNHTGVDSRYFNKFENYDSVGAWNSKESPYYPWYCMHEDGTYTCWWGVDDMPDTNKANPQWQDFVYGADGVVEHWLKAGARGWRLDVADELNDPFIAGIKAAETRVKPDALLLGEVWEDASNKIAYGELRHYLLGDELDSVMNYPFREALLNFLIGTWPAEEMAERMAQLKENYPPAAFAETLNLLGSHDRTRLITVLGGAPDKDALTDEQRAAYRLSDGQRGLAKGRLWLAALVQMCSPGVPCVYYGDEAGVEGYTDPYNRATFPWGHEDGDIANIWSNAMALRRSLPVLVEGDFEPFSAGPDVYGFWRYGTGEDADKIVCVLVNRSLSDVHEVTVPRYREVVRDLVSGAVPELGEDTVTVHLNQLGSAVLYMQSPSKLAEPLERGSGVMAHVTSLPHEGGPGTLGAEAHQFVEWLAKNYQSYWQVLPVNPTDFFGSPYAGLSAFAGNMALVDTAGYTLDELYARWQAGEPLPTGTDMEVLGRGAFDAFKSENDNWLRPYAAFMAIKSYLADQARTAYEEASAKAKAAGTDAPAYPAELMWSDWPEPYHTYAPELAERPELQDKVAFHEFCQFLFDVQWTALRTHADELGIKIVGDMPMYVSEDSADTWAYRTIFNLDEQGKKLEMAGVPGDAFAPEGQLWGNPTYRWDVLEEQDYEWWLARFSRALELYDVVRLDHFVGFENYYAIQAGQKASEGSWKKGPGIKLFERAAAEFGPLPMIAEDLGTITPAVRALVAQCGFFGMDVMAFYDGDPRAAYVPAAGKIAYTSTHDTDTLLGWVTTKWGYADQNQARTVAEGLLCSGLRSASELVIMPLQDVLGLGSEARMNVPGTAEGNWRWQATQAQIDSASDILRLLTIESNRLPQGE